MKICKKCKVEKPVKKFIVSRGVVLDICRECNINPMCKCGKIKERKTNPYCNPCYQSYKEQLKEKKNNGDFISKVKFKKNKLKDDKINDIKSFVSKIINDKMMVTLGDINDIISYYLSTTDKPTEFDQYKPGQQIQFMFNRLLLFIECNK